MSKNVQDKILLTWKAILDTDDIKPDDNFFRLGGTSVMAFQMLFKLSELNITISEGQFLENPTIENLTAQVAQ